MTRTATTSAADNRIPLPAVNNIYTVLAAAALIVALLATACVYMRAQDLFGGLTSVPPSTSGR